MSRVEIRRRWLVTGAVAAAVVLVFWLFGSPPVGPYEGERAIDFALETLDGRPVSLKDFAGKPVFVNFWATWCLPCLVEMPIIEELYNERPGAFAVVAVSDEPVETIREYVEKHGYTFPIYVDRGGKMGQEYQVLFMPTSVFIDAKGVIQARHLGELNRSLLESYLERIGAT